ncbi:MAG TPA: cytochrome c3 family protein [Haliangiales bacterium]|nr:cytochrome c3 family protein [Haliangiales bacterium]
MRLLAVVLLLAFDHVAHDAKVVVSGAAPADCAACHAGARTRCAGCHKPRRFGAGGRDFSLIFPHDEHEACARCHVTPPAKPPAPSHDRCQACHQPMTACATCHRLGVGRDLTPHLAPSRAPIRFSHAAHAARGESCLPCHEGATHAKGELVLRPTMEACERCHDGRAAFSAMGACRRCHDRPDPASLPSDAPARPFDHAAHEKRGLALACGGCHAVGTGGVPAPIAHAACSGCHAADFRSPRPTTCAACHVGTEPWRPLKADAPRRVATEFGSAFSHAAHLDGIPPRTAAGCASCHAGIPGGSERRIGAGHAACACHAVEPPRFEACTSCHQLGLLPERDRRRETDAWSVAASFRHDANHEAACGRCHPTAAAARAVDVIETPKKAACAPCHDGKMAFKMTGHACARCHGQLFQTK